MQPVAQKDIVKAIRKEFGIPTKKIKIIEAFGRVYLRIDNWMRSKNIHDFIHNQHPHIPFAVNTKDGFYHTP